MFIFQRTLQPFNSWTNILLSCRSFAEQPPNPLRGGNLPPSDPKAPGEMSEKQPQSGGALKASDDAAWSALEDADPLTVDPMLVPAELRGAIMMMQAEYRQLEPFEKELTECAVWKDFDDEVEEALQAYDAKWAKDDKGPMTKDTVTHLYTERDRIHDKIFARHQAEALKDPEKLKQFLALEYVQQEQSKLQKRSAAMSPGLRAALKDEANPLNPKMTHSIHKTIKDLLDD